MKIVTTADWHLRNSDSYGVYDSSGVNDFLIERVAVANEIIDAAYKSDAHLVIAGDFLDDRVVDSITLYHSSYLAKELNNVKATILLEGNHGFDGKDNKHSIIAHLKYHCPDNVHIVTEPCFVDVDDVRYFCIPAINDIEKLFPSILEGFIKKIKKNKSNILLLHAPIMNAKFDSGIKAKNGVKLDHIRIASDRFDYVVCGDFHRYQKLFDNAWYTGSPLQTSLRDRNQVKGYQVIDLDTKKVSFKKINSYQFIEASWIVGESICPLLKNPEKYKGTLKNAIVIIRLVKKLKSDEPPIEHVKERLLKCGVKRVFVDKKTKTSEKRRATINSNMGIPAMIEAYVEHKNKVLPAKQSLVVESGLRYLR